MERIKNSGIKRGFDVIFSLVILVLSLPICALLIMAILISMRRPVLFRQKRPGLSGKIFNICKFRTMHEDKRPGMSDKARLSTIGNIMRRMSLDELPSLWNVLKGDMSIVGPRPLLVEYLNRYTPEQARRHDVRPGITGWAQINGRNAINWEEKFKLDVWYVDHISLWLDMKILALTAWKVFQREGINEPGQATMSKFMGQEMRRNR